MKKKPTIIDIARRCGVSTATVSRVLNPTGYPVSDTLRRQVLEAADALHYTPNHLGRSLKTSHSRDLGVVVPNITNPYYALLTQSIYDVALRAGYHVILCSAYRDPAVEADSIRTLLSKQVDGILLASINPDLTALHEALRYQCPVVAMEQALPVPCLQVDFDYRQGGYLAAGHLIGQGHRRIGFIGAPLDRPSRRAMLSGYRDCLRDHGLPCREEDVVLSDREREQTQIYEFDNGAHCARVFIERSPRPTGYVCLNDMTALGVIRAFADHGLRVPGDLSVIGFDNIPYCQIADPPLTTIDQRAAEMGGLAARLLLMRIEDPGKAQESVTLRPALVIRNSVAPPGG